MTPLYACFWSCQLHYYSFSRKINSQFEFIKINNSGSDFLRTSDIAIICGIKTDHACHIASRLAESGHLVKLKRDAWTFADKYDSMLMPSWLATPFPSYISLQTALYFHGMISQMPVVNYSVSPARTRVYRTSVGIFSIHHIGEDFFFGFDADAKTGIKMAVPEKALLDFFYLSPAKSRLFTSLPELEIPRGFSLKRAEYFIKKISSAQRRSLVKKRFDNIFRM